MAMGIIPPIHTDLRHPVDHHRDQRQSWMAARLVEPSVDMVVVMSKPLVVRRLVRRWLSGILPVWRSPSPPYLVEADRRCRHCGAASTTPHRRRPHR